MAPSEHSPFSRDERGAVAMIFALLITSLFGFLALAIDMARAYRAESRIAIALDAAALAGARALGDGRTDDEIRANAKALFDNTVSHSDRAVGYSNFRVEVDRWNDIVTVSTDANMKTAFGGVVGRKNIDLNGSTTVKYRIRRLELAMSLDVTGSMLDPVSSSGTGAPSSSKLDAMKSAAKEVLNVMFDSVVADDRVRVSLVPWSTAVNLGALADTVSANASTDNCVIERLGANAATDALPYGSDASRAFSSPPSSYTCPPSPVVPLLDRSRSSDLETAIDNLQATGGTAGHIGTAWGWYTLAPGWSGIWPTASRPRAYNPVEVIKAVLIMTDGEFNVSWKTTTDWYGNQTLMRTESYDQFQALCQSMKDRQIVIYTIGFALNDSNAINQMRTCATSASSFMQASTETELKDAFKKVAEELKAMRITR